MKASLEIRTIQLFLILMLGANSFSNAQSPMFEFGKAEPLKNVVSEQNKGESLLKWFNVNTYEDTWSVKDDILICSGQPIGVVRSEKQYETLFYT